MFTGIIQKLGRIHEAAQIAEAGELSLSVESPFSDSVLGESIAVNGVCLTIARLGPGVLSFHASRETLARTNLGSLKAGSSVNLERALLASDRLSGHIVQGHVDGLARFTGAQASGECHELTLELPEALAEYCVEKGSIALNGVSLTINHVQGCRIGITLIPHTWANTNLSLLGPGDAVNVEIDIFAKYARRFAGGLEMVCQS